MLTWFFLCRVALWFVALTRLCWLHRFWSRELANATSASTLMWFRTCWCLVTLLLFVVVMLIYGHLMNRSNVIGTIFKHPRVSFMLKALDLVSLNLHEKFTVFELFFLVFNSLFKLCLEFDAKFHHLLCERRCWFVFCFFWLQLALHLKLGFFDVLQVSLHLIFEILQPVFSALYHGLCFFLYVSAIKRSNRLVKAHLFYLQRRSGREVGVAMHVIAKSCLYWLSKCRIKLSIDRTSSWRFHGGSSHFFGRRTLLFWLHWLFRPRRLPGFSRFQWLHRSHGRF